MLHSARSAYNCCLWTSSSWRTESLDNSFYNDTARSPVSLLASSSSSVESPVAAVTASSSSSSMSLGTPSFDLGNGIGSRWVAFYSKSCIDTLAFRQNWVIREGWMRAPVQCP